MTTEPDPELVEAMRHALLMIEADADVEGTLARVAQAWAEKERKAAVQAFAEKVAPVLREASVVDVPGSPPGFADGMRSANRLAAKTVLKMATLCARVADEDSASLRAENEALKAERDEALRRAQIDQDGYDDLRDLAAKAAEEASAERSKREALEAAARHLVETYNDRFEPESKYTLAEFGAAFDALAALASPLGDTSRGEAAVMKMFRKADEAIARWANAAAESIELRNGQRLVEAFADGRDMERRRTEAKEKPQS